jgi:hypothetical protein
MSVSGDTLMVPRGAVGPQQMLGLDGQPLRARAPAFDDEIAHKAEIFRRLGDLDDIELLFNDVLVAKYIRGNVSEHLVAAPQTQREDQWQGVCGLVLKLGPTAFVDDEHTKFPVMKWGRPITPGDWVLYRNSDGWDKDIQMVGEYDAVKCRIIQDAHIRGRVRYPGRLF